MATGLAPFRFFFIVVFASKWLIVNVAISMVVTVSGTGL